jgi:spermidine/putrescine transport system permease protein
MILPLYNSIEKLDHTYIEAAHDLGASRWYTLRHIIIPLTLPGIITGAMLVFLPAMTLFYIPNILGGAKSMLLGNLIENQFLVGMNWPEGAAITVGLIAFTLLFILLQKRMQRHANQRGLL